MGLVRKNLILLSITRYYKTRKEKSMSKTYNLYIQKKDIQRQSSQEVEDAKLAQKFAIKNLSN